MTELRPTQLAYLRSLAAAGPAVAPTSSQSTPRWLCQLEDAGLVEHHPPRRIRITPLGHEALDRAEAQERNDD